MKSYPFLKDMQLWTQKIKNRYDRAVYESFQTKETCRLQRLHKREKITFSKLHVTLALQRYRDLCKL